MNFENLREFVRDLFTLRTVWIDRGGGKWTVKKKLHPLLKSIFWTLALIVSAGVYSSLNNIPNSGAKAEAKPEAIKLVELEELETAPPVSYAQNQEIIIPLNNKDRKTYEDYEEFLSREMNSDAGRIIKGPLRNPEAANIKPEAIKTITPKNPVKDDKYHIEISKSEYTLYLFQGNELVKTYPVAVGKNPGDKKRVGDNRTPTGNFKIVSIENASKWSHDFRDGKGKIKGAYGPWFLRLDAKGWKGIGIHGTHDPDSRGTNATEGCIRLSNEDIDELKQYAYKNMPVLISEE